MPQFSFKARKRSGELVQGVLEGPDRSAVLSQMERQGLLPISLEASKGKKGSTPAKARQADQARHPPQEVPRRHSFASGSAKNANPSYRS